MLKKNKDYIEMRVSSTDCAFTQNSATKICVDGYVYTTYMNLPDPGELYILISKEKFDQLQTENEQLKKKLSEFDFMGWMESAKLWKGRYNDLSKLVGFSSEQEIEDYLVNEAECDTLYGAIHLMCEEMDRRQKKIDELRSEVKCISDEWYSANSTNNSWKAAAECNSPKELIEKREALEKEIGVYSRALQEWKEGTGCPSPSSAKTLIESGASWHHAYNEAKASNVKLRELEKENADLYAEIRKWKDLTKSEIPEAAATWISSYESACGRGNRLAEMVEKLKEEVVSWKNVTGYSTPEDYMHARISGAFHTPFDYTAAWQEATGCASPEEAKTLIAECEVSWRHAYNEIKKANEKLGEEVAAWKAATGYSIPEDYLHARLNDTTSFDYTDAWQKATGCDTPEQAKERIKALNERIDESEACYNHLLMLTGFESEGEIEDALDKCDHSTLRKALVDYEFDYDNLLKLTGYKSEHDIRVALNYSEQFVYETMRELINSLKRNAKFTESNWKSATGCDTPGMAEEKLEYYKKRLGNAVQAASCATKHLENITF